MGGAPRVDEEPITRAGAGGTRAPFSDADAGPPVVWPAEVRGRAHGVRPGAAPQWLLHRLAA
eukprot:762474-Prymnesium_polylepis.1